MCFLHMVSNSGGPSDISLPQNVKTSLGPTSLLFSGHGGYFLWGVRLTWLRGKVNNE